MLDRVEYCFLGNPHPRVRFLLAWRRDLGRAIRCPDLDGALLCGLFDALRQVNLELEGLRGVAHA